VGRHWLLVGDADVDGFGPLFLIFFLSEISGGGDEIVFLGPTGGTRGGEVWVLAFRGRIFFLLMRVPRKRF
jgi:hypothetical protein